MDYEQWIVSIFQQHSLFLNNIAKKLSDIVEEKTYQSHLFSFLIFMLSMTKSFSNYLPAIFWDFKNV